jgi:nicotinate-nucleotide adenylyltransferase
VLAAEAHSALGLDRVLFVPVGVAPHREIEHDPGAEARLEMCELALRGDERFEVSRLEVDREGPAYTVDTLRELSGRADDELVLLLGADQAARLPQWRDPDEVLRLAAVAIAARPGLGATRAEVRRALSGVVGGDGVEFFDMPRVDVSASDIRARVREGRPIRYFVPLEVASYIAERGLYRAPVAAEAS